MHTLRLLLPTVPPDLIIQGGARRSVQLATIKDMASPYPIAAGAPSLPWSMFLQRRSQGSYCRRVQFFITPHSSTRTTLVGTCRRPVLILGIPGSIVDLVTDQTEVQTRPQRPFHDPHSSRPCHCVCPMPRAAKQLPMCFRSIAYRPTDKL